MTLQVNHLLRLSGSRMRKTLFHNASKYSCLELKNLILINNLNERFEKEKIKE